MAVSLFTSTVVGHIHMPVVDRRIAAHVDVPVANENSEGPAASADSVPVVKTPRKRKGSVSTTDTTSPSAGI